MTIHEILAHFHTENEITAEAVAAIQNEAALRKKLINLSRQNKNREFALALLNKFITIRKDPTGDMPASNLMFACYNLAMHSNLEDCLKIWEAKYADFDTYCGLDIELVVFAGVEQTIAFLKQQTSVEAQDALHYVTDCVDADDIEEQAHYFSPSTSQWFL